MALRFCLMGSSINYAVNKLEPHIGAGASEHDFLKAGLPVLLVLIQHS